MRAAHDFVLCPEGRVAIDPESPRRLQWKAYLVNVISQSLGESDHILDVVPLSVVRIEHSLQMVDGGPIPKLEKGSLFLFSDGPDCTEDLYRHIFSVVPGR